MSISSFLRMYIYICPVGDRTTFPKKGCFSLKKFPKHDQFSWFYPPFPNFYAIPPVWWTPLPSPFFKKHLLPFRNVWRSFFPYAYEMIYRKPIPFFTSSFLGFFNVRYVGGPPLLILGPMPPFCCSCCVSPTITISTPPKEFEPSSKQIPFPWWNSLLTPSPKGKMILFSWTSPPTLDVPQYMFCDTCDGATVLFRYFPLRPPPWKLGEPPPR